MSVKSSSHNHTDFWSDWCLYVSFCSRSLVSAGFLPTYKYFAAGRVMSTIILRWTRRLNSALLSSSSIALVRHMEETLPGERLTHWTRPGGNLWLSVRVFLLFYYYRYTCYFRDGSGPVFDGGEFVTGCFWLVFSYIPRPSIHTRERARYSLHHARANASLLGSVISVVALLPSPSRTACRVMDQCSDKLSWFLKLWWTICELLDAFNSVM